MRDGALQQHAGDPECSPADQAQHRARQPLVDDGTVVVVGQAGPKIASST